ncbi:MAG: hypothetical protein JNM39_07245 [Bdellovibrionaceae bacterium]|nr:hypothetical protein [Pseudobdellovibrionaceae bacterium]
MTWLLIFPFAFHRTPIIGDVTPDAVNWADVIVWGGCNLMPSTLQTFAGLDVPIQVTISTAFDDSNMSMQYTRDGGAWLPVISNESINLASVVNGTTLNFRFTGYSTIGKKIIVTITNATDGNTQLDTLTATQGNCL